MHGLFKKQTTTKKESVIITVLLQNKKSENIFLGSYGSFLNITVFSETYDRNMHETMQDFKAWGMMHHLDAGFTICSFLVSICCYDTVASVTLLLSELHFLLAASVEKPEAEWVAMTEVTFPQINWSLIDYLTAIDHPKWCWKILVQKCKGICFNFFHYLASMYYQFSGVRRIRNGRDFCQNKKSRLAI